jgi:hypothetical protein
MAEPAAAAPPLSAIALCEQRYNNRTLALVDNSKQTYLINYRKFLTWYTNNDENAALGLSTEVAEDGTRVYATQHNTEMFYTHYVPGNVKGSRDNAKRYFYAIQWFRDNLEKPLGPKIVESLVVKTA